MAVSMTAGLSGPNSNHFDDASDLKEGKQFELFRDWVHLEFLPASADPDGFRVSKCFRRSFRLERFPDPIGEDAYRLVSR